LFKFSKQKSKEVTDGYQSYSYKRVNENEDVFVKGGVGPRGRSTTGVEMIEMMKILSTGIDVSS